MYRVSLGCLKNCMSSFSYKVPFVHIVVWWKFTKSSRPITLFCLIRYFWNYMSWKTLIYGSHMFSVSLLLCYLENLRSSFSHKVFTVQQTDKPTHTAQCLILYFILYPFYPSFSGVKQRFYWVVFEWEYLESIL